MIINFLIIIQEKYAKINGRAAILWRFSRYDKRVNIQKMDKFILSIIISMIMPKFSKVFMKGNGN